MTKSNDHETEVGLEMQSVGRARGATFGGLSKKCPPNGSEIRQLGVVRAYSF